MRIPVLVVVVAVFVAPSPVFAQQMEDVVHLKNGEIVRGIIIEQIPGESLKIQTQGGSAFVYTMDEIAKITKEPVEMGSEKDAPVPEAKTETPSSQAVQPGPTPSVCLIGEHSGFPEADARTAALLVCGELRKQGIPVGEPVYRAPNSTSIYRVALHRLGQKLLVRLSHENPVGTVIIERQIQLGNIEETISAAPRLVDALVHRKSLASTVDMESVVEQEARELRKISGESFWDIGFSFSGTTNRVGFRLGWFHETPAYAAGVEWGSVGGSVGTTEEDSYTYHFFGIGGRYFFNNKNFSPYVGGGAGIAGSTGYEYGDEDDSNMGAYAVGGIEAMRLTRVRVRLELRVDFADLPNQDGMLVTVGSFFSW